MIINRSQICDKWKHINATDKKFDKELTQDTSGFIFLQRRLGNNQLVRTPVFGLPSHIDNWSDLAIPGEAPEQY